MSSVDVSSGHKRLYVAVAAALALWIAALTVVTVILIPDLYWYSYYAVDYTLGFLRRGLAGEVLSWIPGQNQFIEQRIGRWLSSGTFIAALAALSWWVAFRSGRSERRVQLALLVAVLPFGFAFGLLQAGSTLFGGAALLVFAIVVAGARSDRSVVIASAVFGIVVAVTTLVHEAIPLLHGLGVIAVLVVLANNVQRDTLWKGLTLALGPGLATALAVAAFGKRGVSAELCALIPNGQVNNPLAGNPTTGELLSGYKYYVDYQDWACRNITPFYDRNLVDAIHYVGRLGPDGMVVNTLFGIGVFAITILAIGWVSGVPFRRMRMLLEQHRLLVAVGILMLVPVFMTGVDWVRWWVVIALDIGAVYLLYASRQPEADEPPTRRSTRAFVVTTIVLALFPVGIVPAFLAPLPI